MGRVLSVLCLAFLVSACASSGGAPSGGASNCTPEGAGPGDEIVCSLDGLEFEEGSTCFVGETPAACRLLPDGDLEITLPPRTGSFDIGFAGGDGPRTTIAEGFVVEVSEDEPADTPPPEEPTDPSGPPPTPPSPPPAEPPPSDPPADDSPPPDGVPTGPVSVSLELTPLHDTRLGLLKVEGTVSGNPSETYVYLPGNRLVTDETCGLEEGRYLAVNPSGTNLVEGEDSSNFIALQNQGLLTAVECDEATDNCLNFSPDAGDPIHCRINLQPGGFSFHTRMWVKNFKVVLAARREDGTWAFAEEELTAPPPTITMRSFEIDRARPKVRIEFSYNRALKSSVRSESGQCSSPWCGIWNPATVFPAEDDGSGDEVVSLPFQHLQREYTVRVYGLGEGVTRRFKISCSRPEATIVLGSLYEGQTGSDVVCATVDDECDGAGFLRAEGRVRMECAVMEQQLEAGEPVWYEASEEFGGGTHPVWGPSTMVQVPWVGNARLIAVGGDCADGEVEEVTAENNDVEITGSGTAVIDGRLPRNHGCTQYKVTGHDVGGGSFASGILSRPYRAWFRIHGFGATCDFDSNYVAYWYDDGGVYHSSCAEPSAATLSGVCRGSCWSYGDAFCSMGSGYGDDQCLEGPKITVYGNWQGRHIKRVYSPNCGGELTIPQPDPDDYDVQGTTSTSLIEGTFEDPFVANNPDRRDPDMPDARWSTGMCLFEAETWDGTIIRSDSDGGRNDSVINLEGEDARNGPYDPVAGVDHGCNC